MSTNALPISLRTRELASWLADATRTQPLLLDVREDWEFEHCHLKDALHMPMAHLPERLHELEGAINIVCICHHGIRSLQIARYLISQGHEHVFNLQGGVEAWSQEVDPTLPRY